MIAPRSRRLRYEHLGDRNLGHFLHLAIDRHVRRYLLDGALVGAPWCRTELERSDRLFETRGVGLWLIREQARALQRPVGFAGFRIFEDMSPEPQLIYALTKSASGRGYASEAAGALLRVARAAGFASILAAVDAPNRASIRVLQKLGFRRFGSLPGAFGQCHLFRRNCVEARPGFEPG